MVVDTRAETPAESVNRIWRVFIAAFRAESSAVTSSAEGPDQLVDKSFLWFLFPPLLQTVLGVGVMVPLTHLLS